MGQQDSLEVPRAYEDRIQASLKANPNGLTADQVAKAAMRTAPSVEIRQGEIIRSKANQDNTLSRFVPALTLSALVTRNSATNFDFGGQGLSVGALNPGQLQVGQCADGSGTNCVVDTAGQPVGAIALEPFKTPRTNYNINAQINIPISDYLLSLPAARRGSKLDIQGATLRRDFERQRVALDARVAYFEWLRARAQVAIAKESLISVRARLADAKIALQLGTVTPADVLQIESIEASSQIAIVNATSFEELAQINLATLMGEKTTHFEVGEDVWAALPEPQITELKELIEHGQNQRADLRALVAQTASLKEAATGVRSQLYPRLDGFASIVHANPNPQFFPPRAVWNTNWSVGLNLSWGLERFFQGRAQKKELLANARIFDAQLEAAKRGVRLEVTRAFQGWQRARKAAKLNHIDVTAAEAGYSQRVSLYRAGEATTSEVVEAELARFNASLRNVNARIDLQIAVIQLRHAAALNRGNDLSDPGHPVPVPSVSDRLGPGPQNASTRSR